MFKVHKSSLKLYAFGLFLLMVVEIISSGPTSFISLMLSSRLIEQLEGLWEWLF